MDTGMVGVGVGCVIFLIGMYWYDQLERKRRLKLLEKVGVTTYKGFPFLDDTFRALIGKEIIAYRANSVEDSESHVDMILEVGRHRIRTRCHGWVSSIDYVIEDVLPEMAAS